MSAASFSTPDLPGRTGDHARSHVSVRISGPTIAPSRAFASHVSASGFQLNGISGVHQNDVLHIEFPDHGAILCSVTRVRGSTARVKVSKPAGSQPLPSLLETDHALYSAGQSHRKREKSSFEAEWGLA